MRYRTYEELEKVQAVFNRETMRLLKGDGKAYREFVAACRGKKFPVSSLYTPPTLPDGRDFRKHYQALMKSIQTA